MFMLPGFLPEGIILWGKLQERGMGFSTFHTTVPTGDPILGTCLFQYMYWDKHVPDTGSPLSGVGSMGVH